MTGGAASRDRTPAGDDGAIVATLPGRLRYRRLLAINAFWFGNGAHWQPIFVSLIPVGARLVDPVNKDVWLAG